MKASRYVKDHVSGYGKQIKNATNKKFGINNSLIIRAVNGDNKALKQIGDLGKTGERLAMAMPSIRENLKAYIEGITEYNTALADVYKTGGKGAIAIDKALSDVTLENTRYGNLIEEYKTSLFAKLESENQRHEDSLNVIELQAWVDAQMATVNAKANLEAISNKPFLAQMKADADYENKMILHLLENGSDSDLSLIPKKHYSTNPLVKFWNQIREIFS
ncbi:MAG: hypothetical protein HC836_10345 [Richelia sp. RM2_1_2]|nr:hypothetical protein [Richelia sp. SM2_1_7]NJM17372.1 hypothetical protein [Richelia sp. SM1_7_0]NJN13265.1 hypothetical protein [Richelia sp. RM1_1_1]NJO26882.1 hypothetical protein [Richelia sp. SL_2_1]NJO58723.1 hypothetical protein [Richelia sp. RM2_1_2]